MNEAVCSWSNMFGGTTPKQNGTYIDQVMHGPVHFLWGCGPLHFLWGWEGGWAITKEIPEQDEVTKKLCKVSHAKCTYGTNWKKRVAQPDPGEKKTFLLRKINQPPWKIQCIVSGPSLTVNFFKEFCPEINKTNNIYNCHEKTYTCSWQTDLNNIQNVPVACVMFKKTKDIHLYSQLRTEEENTDNITTLANAVSEILQHFVRNF